MDEWNNWGNKTIGFRGWLILGGVLGIACILLAWAS